jgi:hypothetical protein
MRVTRTVALCSLFQLLVNAGIALGACDLTCEANAGTGWADCTLTAGDN